MNLKLETLCKNPDDYDPSSEWKGMPDFESNNIGPYRQIIVSFASEEDIEAFSKLIGQPITPKAKSLWFPAAEIGIYHDKRYVDSK